jgi:uncharacterized protein (DUF2249 family)
MLPHAAVPVIDVRRLAPRDRHPLVFSTFVALAPGASMELLNDLDTDPLHQSFQLALPGKFGWEVLEGGPEVWRVRITRQPDGTRHDGYDAA